MGMVKSAYIEWLESQISDADWAELDAYLDEQDRQWFAAQGIDIEAELEEQREGRADEEWHRRGQW